MIVNKIVVLFLASKAHELMQQDVKVVFCFPNLRVQNL